MSGSSLTLAGLKVTGASFGVVQATGTTTNIQAAYVQTKCVSSPCVIASSTPGVAYITRVSTGVYYINFNAGVFAAGPYCMGITLGYNLDIMQMDSYPSATANEFLISNFSGTSVDDGFQILCFGH
jgi:hypothetical protein